MEKDGGLSKIAEILFTFEGHEKRARSHEQHSAEFRPAKELSKKYVSLLSIRLRETFSKLTKTLRSHEKSPRFNAEWLPE